MCTLVNRVASALVATILILWSVPAYASITGRIGPTNLYNENRQFYKFDAAFDSVNNVYLIVWGTQAFGPTNGLFLDAAGNPIGGRFDISGGGEWAGWARVVFAPQEGKFLVSYTKILNNAAAHQRVARFVTFQSSGSHTFSNEIIIDTWAGGAGGQPGMAYVPANGSRGSRFLVTWWNYNANPPQSYAAALDASGNILSSFKISRDGDGQTDSEIACDAARDRCLVIGFAWGVYSYEVSPTVAGMPGTWGRYISASTGEPLGAGFMVDAWRDENDASIAFSEAGDRYIVAFARNFRSVWGVTVNGSSLARSEPYLIKASLGESSEDGGGYGRPRLAYNTGSQTTFVAMNPWIARTAVQELDSQGQVIADGFDMMPARTNDYNQGTKEVALAANGNSNRFMVSDNQAFILLRAAVYNVGAATPLPCSYSINPTSVSLGSGAADGTIFVTTGSGCAWEAASNSGFISIQNGTGRSGSGSVPFSVAANTSGARTGTATIAGITFTVNQASGIVCTYSITPTSVSLGNGEADGTINVSTQAGCPWSAVSQSAFITFHNGSGRSGSGSLGFSVMKNYVTSSRSGTGVVAGQLFSVLQQPAPLDEWAKAAGNARADFDGDGNNDLLLQDLVGGELVSWKLQGHNVVAGTALSHRLLDTKWRVAGTADFNGDGKPDIVWQHPDGWMYLWYMDGVTRIGGTYLSINRLLDTRWRVAAIGDFDFDGKPDLIWQHPGGWLAAWLMDGATVKQSVNLNPGSVLDTRWQIAGAGDFNGDGNPDLVWRHTGHGEVGVWLMSGLTRQQYVSLKPGAVTDQQWAIAAISDINGDNAPDIIWEHESTGWTAAWYMNGMIRSDNPSLSSSVPPNWKIMAAK